MKQIVMILMLGLVFTLTGCETMKGVGKDLQKAGEALEKKADSSTE
jgi:predicted small secreted protein